MYIILLILLSANGELPIYLTEEEKGRLDEIGTYTSPTAPPIVTVYAPGEYDHARGVLLRWSNSFQQLYIALVDTLSNFTRVYLVCNSTSDSTSIANTLQSNGVPLDSVEFVIRSTNTIWIRDYGPWWIYHEDGTRGIADWTYNRPRPQDDTLNIWLGSDWGIPVYTTSLVHTGGNFMVDGLGVGFCSNLIYEENDLLSHQEVQQEVYDYMGLDTLFVFQRINGEYTGHIDMWGKLVDDHTFLVAWYPEGDPNHDILNQHAATIANLKNGNGVYFDTVRIPSPPVTGGHRTYTNSLIVNKNVLMPVYGHSYDAVAESIYQAVLPDYNIYPFDCSGIIGSGGAVHCISKLVHHISEIFFTHHPFGNVEYTGNPYPTDVMIFSSIETNSDSVILYWNTDGSSSFDQVFMVEDNDTVGLFKCDIPSQSVGTTIYYYIEARDTSNFVKTTPLNTPYDLYSFTVIEDIMPPDIVHNPLSDQTVNSWPATVSATITDNLEIDSVFLEFYINAFPSDTIPMVKESSHTDVYSADFTGSVNVGDEVFYRIIARDASVNHNVSYSPVSGYYSFSIIGKIETLILDLDDTPLTGLFLDSLFDEMGISHNYTTTFDSTQFIDYNSLFILLGIYSNNTALNNSEANAIVNYLEDSGRIYMEGGDCWAYDASRSIYNPYFGINGEDDGETMSTPVSGVSGTFTEGMSFGYTGENNWIDEIAPTGSGFDIFNTSSTGRGVANSSSGYKTAGLSYELGGLTDGTGVSRRDTLVQKILDFFEIQAGIEIAEKPQGPLFYLKNNPAIGTILLGYEASGKGEIDLFDVSGRRVYSTTTSFNNRGEITLNPERLPQGLYFVRIHTDKYKKVLKCVYLK